MTDINTVEQLDCSRVHAIAQMLISMGVPYDQRIGLRALNMSKAIRKADERAGLLTVPVEPTEKMLFGTKAVSMRMVWERMIEVSPFFLKVAK